MEQKKKLTKKQLFGYSLAGMGDNGGYSFISSFLLFYLTSIAGVSSVRAGFIASFGSLFDMVCNPIIGYISDNSVSRFGRRRPFILSGSCVFVIALFFLFYKVPWNSDLLKSFYYAAMLVLFWFGFSLFAIPYMAFGAELTSDYDERTKLRACTSVCYMLGSLVGMVLPTAVVAFATAREVPLADAWHFAAIAVALISLLSVLYTWNSTRGSETSALAQTEMRSKVSIFHMFREYGEVIKLKPLRYLVAGSILFLMSNTMIATGRMYFVTYNMRMSAGMISFVYLYAGLISLIAIPLISRISGRIGKRQTYIFIILVGAASSVFFGFYRIETLPELFIYLFFMRFTSNAYWQLFPSMNYDICEVDEFIHGKRREGTISSVMALSEALSASFSLLVLGFILDLSGFSGNTMEQSETALSWMLYIFTFLPAVFMALSTVAVCLYPLNRENFNRLKIELDKKRRNEAVNIEGLERIL